MIEVEQGEDELGNVQTVMCERSMANDRNADTGVEYSRQEWLTSKDTISRQAI